MATTDVAKARKSALLSQEELAEKLGVSVVTLSKWENDPDRYFTAERLRTYSDNVGQDGKRYLREYVSSFFN